MSSIGSRIRNRRVELGLTVDELAKMLNKNRATIYRYEGDGIENLPITIIEPLAKVLKVTPGYLMGWKEDSEETNIGYGFMVFRKRLDNQLSCIDPADCAEAGVDYEALVDIAEGNRHFTFDEACTIADSIGVSLDYMSGLSDDDNNLIGKHLSLYNKLTDEQQRLIDAQIKGILQEK